MFRLGSFCLKTKLGNGLKTTQCLDESRGIELFCGERGICPVLSIPLLLSLSAVIKNLLTEILTSFFDCFWCKSVL